jgi:hypothetical protein
MLIFNCEMAEQASKKRVSLIGKWWEVAGGRWQARI